MEATDYQTEAAEFVKRTGITLAKKYVGHRPYFPGDTEQRAVWEITITREQRRPYTFTFGQSIVDSYTARDFWTGRALSMQSACTRRGFKEATAAGGGKFQDIVLTPAKVPPTDYDVLSCLEAYVPASFEDFCAEYGYDTDSRKALDTFLAVQKQAAAVASLFTEEERAALPR